LTNLEIPKDIGYNMDIERQWKVPFVLL
jgi:hypothetical protein